MNETTQEIIEDIRDSVAGAQAGTKTVQELVKEIRDAVSGGIMSESDVRSAISEIIGQAPEALDTLEEVAEALSGIYTKSQVDQILLGLSGQVSELKQLDPYKTITSTSSVSITGALVGSQFYFIAEVPYISPPNWSPYSSSIMYALQYEDAGSWPPRQVNSNGFLIKAGKEYEGFKFYGGTINTWTDEVINKYTSDGTELAVPEVYSLGSHLNGNYVVPSSSFTFSINGATSIAVKYMSTTSVNNKASVAVKQLADAYTKSEVDTKFDNVYTKAEVDAAFEGYNSSAQSNQAIGRLNDSVNELKVLDPYTTVSGESSASATNAVYGSDYYVIIELPYQNVSHYQNPNYSISYTYTNPQTGQASGGGQFGTFFNNETATGSSYNGLIFYGGTINTWTGEVINKYASDGTELVTPEVYSWQTYRNSQSSFSVPGESFTFSITGATSVAIKYISSVPNDKASVAVKQLADAYTKSEVDTMISELAETAHEEVEAATESINANAEQIDQNVEDISLLKSHLGAVEIVDTASGAIATFPDGSDDVPVKGLTVQMEPIQDLHGQDAPYPAGGGKNVMHPATSVTASEGLTVSNDNGKLAINGEAASGSFVTLTFEPMVIQTGYIMTFMNSFINSNVYFLNGTTQIDYFSTSEVNRVINAQSLSTLYGKTFNQLRIAFRGNVTLSNANFSPMVILDGADTTTWTPYSNICPISGRQSVTVTRTGVNVWDEEWELGNVGNLGQNVSSSYHIRSKNYISVRPNTRYYNNGYTLAIYAYGADKEFINLIGYIPAGKTFDTPDDCYYIRFYRSTTTYDNDISINYPSTDHDYHPGTVQTVTVQLGQTVYGGTVDVTSGEMVVDRVSVDMGDLDWTVDGARFKAYIDNMPNKTGRTIKMACSCFKALTNGEPYDATADLVCYGAYSYVYVHDFAYTDVAAFKTSVTGQTLCYELAQPITITLTPEQLTTVLGQNNVWSDGGDVSVDYVADTKLYISQLTEPDADMIADTNIVSGKYFMVGNNLYLATANIASGATISPGVNCTRTSLAEALNAINA